MSTFEQLLHSTAEKGGMINTLFEERLFALVGILERIAAPLSVERIPYELIGGMAVMVQVQRVDPSEVRLTKDVDIMIHRADLERVKELAKRHGFKVRFVFSGEKTSPAQVLPNPPLRPERISLHGIEVAVIPVSDLVRMKLSNNRDIDRVHIRDLDAVGLIAGPVEKALPSALLSRLEEIRTKE